MSLRILGGVAKGRELQVPEGARPSNVRIRKSLFDLLASRLPAGPPPGLRFLDMHGGSGAIGLEAASRGYSVTLIEMNPRGVRTLDENARAAQLKVRILKGDAESLLPALGSFDVVFSDPPYAQDIPRLAASLLKGQIVAPGGLLICQHPDRWERVALNLPDHPAFDREQRDYGSNILTIYERREEAEQQETEEGEVAAENTDAPEPGSIQTT